MSFTAPTGSPREELQLVGLVVPFLRVSRWLLAFDDRRPAFGQLRIECDEGALRIRHIVLGVNRLCRTLRNTQGTICLLYTSRCV